MQSAPGVTIEGLSRMPSKMTPWSAMYLIFCLNSNFSTKNVSFFLRFLSPLFSPEEKKSKKKIENSLEGLGPDLLGDLEGAVDVVVAVEEDLGLDDRAQAGGCGEEKKREKERKRERGKERERKGVSFFCFLFFFKSFVDKKERNERSKTPKLLTHPARSRRSGRGRRRRPGGRCWWGPPGSRRSCATCRSGRPDDFHFFSFFFGVFVFPRG